MGATGAILGTQAGLTVLDTYNQYQASKAEEAFNKSVYDINAAISNINAEDAIERGNEEAGRIRRQTKLVLGQQRASFAGQGIDIGTGTAAKIATETTAIGDIEAITIKNNAYREAWGQKVRALGFRTSAAMEGVAGRFTRRSLLTSAGTKLTGIGVRYAIARSNAK